MIPKDHIQRLANRLHAQPEGLSSEHFDAPDLSEFANYCLEMLREVSGVLRSLGDGRIVLLSIPLEDSAGLVIAKNVDIYGLSPSTEPPSIYCVPGRRILIDAQEEYRHKLSLDPSFIGLFRSWNRGEIYDQTYQNGVFIWLKEHDPG